jgi:hypothetical protein
MEFFIKKGANLPALKILIVRDGRSDFETFINNLSSKSIFFSMYDVNTGLPKIVSAPCEIDSYIDNNGDIQYFIYYKFRDIDTKKSGKFRGEFTIKNGGDLILPIKEQLFINIQESYISVDNCCANGSQNLIGLTLFAEFLSGSINANYRLISTAPVPQKTTVTFKNTLSVNSGIPIIILTGVTINRGEISGSTSVVLDGDYNNLTKTSVFSNIVFFPAIANNQFSIKEESTFILPTPTPTPTNTETPTSTPTPTPTSTQAPEENLINPIITDNSEYISVGENFYLQFVDPEIQLSNPIITDNSEYISVGNDLYLQYVDPQVELTPFQLGRKYIKDDRDNNYLISDFYNNLLSSKIYSRPVVATTPTRTPTRSRIPVTPTPTSTRIPLTPTPTRGITSRFWDDNGWWGNQLNTPQCVGFAWSHWISDGPVTHLGPQPTIAPQLIYQQAQKIDEWPGENYAGTSVRAGAKYLKNTNKISSYYWGFDLNTLINTVMNLGPVVVGTNWYYNMFFPVNGVIRTTGSYAGGHAYVINGVDTIKRQFRIKNSWGRNWGLQGRAFISFDDMAKLIRENGEICLAVENYF